MRTQSLAPSWNLGVGSFWPCQTSEVQKFTKNHECYKWTRSLVHFWTERTTTRRHWRSHVSPWKKGSWIFSVSDCLCNWTAGFIFLNSYHKLRSQTKFFLSYSAHAQIFDRVSEENKRLLEETKKASGTIENCWSIAATCQTNERQEVINFHYYQIQNDILLL